MGWITDILIDLNIFKGFFIFTKLIKWSIFKDLDDPKFLS